MIDPLMSLNRFGPVLQATFHLSFILKPIWGTNFFIRGAKIVFAAEYSVIVKRILNN